VRESESSWWERKEGGRERKRCGRDRKRCGKEWGRCGADRDGVEETWIGV